MKKKKKKRKDERGRKASRACFVVSMGMYDCINPPSAYSGTKHLRRSEAVRQMVFVAVSLYPAQDSKMMPDVGLLEVREWEAGRTGMGAFRWPGVSRGGQRVWGGPEARRWHTTNTI